MAQILIDDDFLFNKINIKRDDSFKEFIDKISKYVYENIKLDGIFHIEEWGRVRESLNWHPECH